MELVLKDKSEVFNLARHRHWGKSKGPLGVNTLSKVTGTSEGRRWSGLGVLAGEFVHEEWKIRLTRAGL